MDDKMIALLGGLIGSGLTVFLTKILDLFSTKQQHTLSLKRDFFLRKVEVFEKTVSYWTVVHTTFSNIGILLKTSLEESVLFNQDDQINIFERLDKQLQLVSAETQNLASSIDLYVDLDRSEDVDATTTERFWKLIGETSFLLSNASLNDKKSIENLKQNIDRIYTLSYEIRNRYLKLIQTLREQLKRYE